MIADKEDGSKKLIKKKSKKKSDIQTNGVKKPKVSTNYNSFESVKFSKDFGFAKNLQKIPFFVDSYSLSRKSKSLVHDKRAYEDSASEKHRSLSSDAKKKLDAALGLLKLKRFYK